MYPKRNEMPGRGEMKKREKHDVPMKTILTQCSPWGDESLNEWSSTQVKSTPPEIATIPY